MVVVAARGYAVGGLGGGGDCQVRLGYYILHLPPTQQTISLSAEGWVRGLVND